ncbi:MAG: lytic transglycosylase domain-containing protein [Hyphomicrobiales bacterium]|nr:lytic transglycosylase domain-containing protein [Hyphomicrobiales bacterium]
MSVAEFFAAARPSPPGSGAPPSGVTGAIQRAAQATGASFEYLLATAKVESNLNPGLKARSSSATGLFQFIEQTWLGMVKTTGRAFGLGNYAAAISRTANGRYHVADPQLRQEILRLRRDPVANAAMAGAFTRSNAAVLSRRIGRSPTDSELYMAHFFGSGGAGQLINAARERPQADAVAMFPAAARANRSIFYDRQGQPRSVAAVYGELNRRYQVARANILPALAPSVAAAPPGTAPSVADPDGTTRAFAAARVRPVAAVAEPVFRSLLHADQARGPLAPIVSDLWGSPPAARSADRVTAVASAEQAPLDLFRDMRADVRALFRGNGGP